ncbi:dolichol-phosphate mannosyltransferase subunit 3 [Schizosaccharomyces japonicus yFS275]|uniref:Dolichol-phosphate mannosyltransferase subunit 3 n=1 Tax=Schizosaccharomyces japonicus (strain yFS275 / FY16936) TaxID=402676 RepID=B6JWQ2_SCHJY|nr:dolichol-phosphate mannosyltransferase subunit 3 [Schizosaccharomyces japonicus yFS275]EEB05803.1 dolichol-phosphate mannosyltransferase subunit 3 [Schizosaccharomyces japonicus yFS275]
MQRIHKILVYFILMSIFKNSLYLIDMEEPWASIRPWTSIILLALYGVKLGFELLYNVANTHNKPEAYVDLVKDIKEAQDALRAKGMVIDDE